MQFMVLGKVPSPMGLSEKELAEYAFKYLEWLEGIKKKGILKFAAPYLGRRANVAILEVKSDRELFELLNSDPLYHYAEKEAIPLSTYKDFRKLYQRRYKAAKRLSSAGSRTRTHSSSWLKSIKKSKLLKID